MQILAIPLAPEGSSDHREHRAPISEGLPRAEEVLLHSPRRLLFRLGRWASSCLAFWGPEQEPDAFWVVEQDGRSELTGPRLGATGFFWTTGL
ncbi:hypothetical protein EYF80_068295 [Liparis tanakae]|uniref:Uncharacterized protein n=1 Tax=Liparis tanakae TaxID=230148 RepID=A0A4Z2DYH7_9TELE|nr:hypothetical protein EYF80_068295 [Liparis tanakae]